MFELSPRVAATVWNATSSVRPVSGVATLSVTEAASPAEVAPEPPLMEVERVSLDQPRGNLLEGAWDPADPPRGAAEKPTPERLSQDPVEPPSG